MSREIKFRAWCSFDGMISQVSALSLYPDGRVEKVFDGLLKSTSDVQDVKLMQYTGLRDKNGKEIYEGDIIKSHRWPTAFEKDAYEVISVVKFTETVGKNGFWWDGDDKGEVIGNVWENPELLN